MYNYDESATKKAGSERIQIETGEVTIVSTLAAGQ